MPRKTYHVYTLMEDDLRRQIVAGLLPESKPIWSESVLMAKYGIGRNAVRSAIADLEAEGLLFMKKVREGYLERSKEDKRFQVLSALDTPEEIYKKIRKTVWEVIGK